MKKNALYAQSGGVTAVINATAGALILEAKKSNKIGKVFAAKNGIRGALRGDLIDTSKESSNSLLSLRYRPGGIFGSCRFKLQDLETSEKEYRRLIEVLTYCIMSNHFHVLVRVDDGQVVSDAELMRRYKILYPKPTKYQEASIKVLESDLAAGGETAELVRQRLRPIDTRGHAAGLARKVRAGGSHGSNGACKSYPYTPGVYSDAYLTR